MNFEPYQHYLEPLRVKEPTRCACPCKREIIEGCYKDTENNVFYYDVECIALHWMAERWMKLVEPNDL